MAQYGGSFSGRPAYSLQMTVSVYSQDIAANTSRLNVRLYLSHDTSASNGTYDYASAGWSWSAGSASASGSAQFLMGPSGDYVGKTIDLWNSTTGALAHNADGTLTVSIAGSAGAWSPPGSASLSGSFTLPTIPRATTPTVAPTSGETAATYTITHTPATSSFYHDVAYSLDSGGSYTDIQTDVVGTDTSTDWTPAHTLLPNAASVTAIIRLITRETAGGTIIGTKTVNLPLTVPSSVIPTVSSVAWVDMQTSAPDMPTLMGAAGRFVQKWSKLKPTVTAAGAGGSSIVTSIVTQNGQTTPSGTAFTNAIALSGSTPFSVVATDSRSRTNAAYNSTVSVTAYNFPSLPTPTVVRTSDAGGTTPSSTGTYLKITPTASASSLNFSGEKNLLEWQVRTRPSGGGWTTVQAWTAATVSGVTWTTPYVISGYAASTEYEVEVSIRDLFGKNGYDSSNTVKTLTVIVPSEAVQLDLDGTSGVGIGKYRQNGMLDVNGDVYATNLRGATAVYANSIDVRRASTTSVDGVVELATSSETITGTDTARVVTPAGLTAALDSPTNTPNVAARNRNRIINGTMNVWQRGTSFTSTASGAYSADRWRAEYNGTGATRTISRQAFTLGAAPVAGYESAYFYRYAQSVAGSGATYANIMQQAIEGVRSLANETVTVSFWAKADATRTVTPIYSQFFGTGGSPSTTVSTYAAAQVLTTSWARYTATVAIPSISGKTIGTSLTDALILTLQSSTINATQTIDIWGVQVESGSSVTPFERIPDSEEMLLCQRYFVRWVAGQNEEGFGQGQQITGTTATFLVPLPVPMRVKPSVTLTGVNMTNRNNYSTAVTGVTTVFGGVEGMASVTLQTTNSSVGTSLYPAVIQMQTSGSSSASFSSEL